MIASNPGFYFQYTLVGWIGKNARDPTLEWVVDGITPYLDPRSGKDRIAAACEDVSTIVRNVVSMPFLTYWR